MGNKKWKVSKKVFFLVTRKSGFSRFSPKFSKITKFPKISKISKIPKNYLFLVTLVADWKTFGERKRVILGKNSKFAKRKLTL